MIPRALALLFALTLPTMTFAQPSKTLAEMQDRYRPVLVFQPGKDTRLAQQLRLLTAHRADLVDRQIMLLLRPYAWAGAMDNAILTFSSWEEDKELRRRFHIHPNDFTVILLGKDGTEKFRAHTPVTIDQLSRIIDAMPMRQAEIEAKSRAKPSH